MARQNDHNRAEELISAYLDKRVSAEEQSFFERHIASCADCRAELEATRSMVAALQAMPAMKAPRSFVLPREMAKQPKRSFLSLGGGIILNQSNVATTLSLYPALRLATVVAAMAFVVLFAGDLLISQSGGGSALQSIPAAAPAPVAMQAQVAPTQESEAAESPSAAATAPVEQSAPPAGASAKMSETAVVTEAAALSMPTATPEATAVADASNQSRMMLNATPEPAEPMLGQQADSAAEQSAAASVVETAPAPTIDLLRIIEIALLALAVVLGIATFVVRRRQV